MEMCNFACSHLKVLFLLNKRSSFLELCVCHLKMQSYITKSCCIAVIIHHGGLKVSVSLSHLSLYIFFKITYCGLIFTLNFSRTLLVCLVNSLEKGQILNFHLFSSVTAGL